MKYVIAVYLALLFSSCGTEHVDVSGSVQIQGQPTLTISFNPASLVQVFQPYCEQLLIAQGVHDPSADAIQQCTDIMVSDFLAKVGGIHPVVSK